MPVPVTVLTGFLGSGKTTLLRRLLEGENGRRTAVLINEFGEIGLDHLMVKGVSGSTVVLQNGCVCCSVRSELRSGLCDLVDGRATGDVPQFDRIVIETTGLADPVPVVQTISIDPMLRNQLRLSNLVSTVDAMNGIEQLGTQIEAMRQAATADRLVITKTDLSDEQQVVKLEQALSRINPIAPISRTPGDEDLWQLLLSQDSFDPKSRDKNPAHWPRPWQDCMLKHPDWRMSTPGYITVARSSALQSALHIPSTGHPSPFGFPWSSIVTDAKFSASKDFSMCLERKARFALTRCNTSSIPRSISMNGRTTTIPRAWSLSCKTSMKLQLEFRWRTFCSAQETGRRSGPSLSESRATLL